MFVEQKVQSTDILGQAFLLSSSFEPFTIYIDRIKTKQVDNIVALSENIKNLTGFTSNFEILSMCHDKILQNLYIKFCRIFT